jgi:hypothetical protein
MRVGVIAVALYLSVAGVSGVFAQDDTVTNLTQLAEGDGWNGGIYLPMVVPFQWQVSPFDWSAFRWADFSQLPSLGSLQAPTNFAKAHVYGVELLSIVMTKNLLTGETILQAAWGTDVVARVAGAGSYQPGPGWSPARVALQMWQQAKDCPECWGETDA